MECLDKIQLEPERDVLEVGTESDAESAVTDIGNDVDVEYEVGQSSHPSMGGLGWRKAR